MFSNTILEINEKRPKPIEIDTNIINQIIFDSGIKKDIKSISEPTTWVMQLYKIQLSDGRILILKIGIIQDWSDASSIKNQIKVSHILQSVGIDQPQIINFSENTEKYGFRFILSESQKGKKLYEILNTSSEKEKEIIYYEIGNMYSKIHELKNDWAGIWDGDPGIRKYPIHPAEFYLNAEVKNGSGKYLLENGIISKELYENINKAWETNISFLKDRPNSLIHNSPFPWSIYINKERQTYSISGLSALGDFMWWDKMIDVTHIINPPFLSLTDDTICAFRNGYKHQIDDKTMSLYSILTKICNMAGCYFAPINIKDAEQWNEKQIETIKENITNLI